MPVGTQFGSQRLVRVERISADSYKRVTLEVVLFVPLIGAQGWPETGHAA